MSEATAQASALDTEIAALEAEIDRRAADLARARTFNHCDPRDVAILRAVRGQLARARARRAELL